MISRKIIRLLLVAGFVWLLPAEQTFSQSQDEKVAEREEKSVFWKRLFKKEQTPGEAVHPDLHEFTLEQNRIVPAISSKALPQIRKVTAQEVRRLSKVKQMKVSSERDGEVIKIEIPMSQLFLPNDTLLWNRAGLTLQPLIRYLQIPDYYHILVVAHSDDSGSAAYTEKLTRERVLAVKDWLLAYGALPEFVIAYAVGNRMPVSPNTSENSRERNRRLEVYLVPGEELILDAEKGKISL
ncbi:MAG: OmpA family protein [Coprobacter sp.]|nr:OmpA family protein [Coprobacter sp.]